MKKIILALLFLALNIMPVFSHGGHGHDPLEKIYNTKIVINRASDDEHLGHFYLKKSVQNSSSTRLVKLEQTLHTLVTGTGDITVKDIKATYHIKEKTLRFIFDASKSKVNPVSKRYLIYTDFTDLEGGANSGILYGYDKDPDLRTTQSNEVKVLVDSEHH